MEDGAIVVDTVVLPLDPFLRADAHNPLLMDIWVTDCHSCSIHW